jgi:hypothetical protein
MAARAHFSADAARRVGAEIGIDWDSAPFDLEQFRSGMESNSSTVATTRSRT